MQSLRSTGNERQLQREQNSHFRASRSQKVTSPNSFGDVTFLAQLLSRCNVMSQKKSHRGDFLTRTLLCGQLIRMLFSIKLSRFLRLR